MGNTHSVESRHYEEDHVETNSKRSPHKLSKPRVGNHASPIPPHQASRLLSSHGRTRSASSSLPPSRSNSQLTQAHSSAPSPVQALSESQASAPLPAEESAPAAEPEARPTKNWKRRASLFRSKSSQEPRNESRRESITTSPPLPDRMSRANSMTWETQQEMNTSRQLQVESWHMPGNRQSINYNLMSYESRRLLNLTEDLAACEEGSIMSESNFEVSPSTWKSSHPTQPAIPQLPRANSEVSLYAPVRRRSMIQTPGLATRLPTDYSASRRSSLRYSVATTPACGHSRLNSIESSTYPIQQQPSVEPLTDFFSEPDYMPAPATEPVVRALTPSDMDYRPLGAMKFGSLRITNGVASPLPSPDFKPQAKAEVTEKFQGGKEEYSIRDVELGGLRSDNTDVEMTVSAVHASTALSPIDTSFLRVDSRSQRSNLPLSPELQTTSKHTALEDELFEDDDVQLEYSAEVLTVRNDPNAKPSLERLRSEQSKRNSQAIVRTDSGVVASPTMEQPKPLSKADSGYSSNVSLRSFNTKQSAAKAGQRRRTASEDSGDEQSDGVASPTAAVSNGSPIAGPSHIDGLATGHMPSSPPTCPPPQPKSDVVAPPKSPTSTSSPKFFLNLNAGHSFRKDRKGLTVIDSAKLAKEGSISPQSIRPGDASPDNSTSALSIGTGSQRAGRFQRFMSGSGMRGPPAVHTTHPSDKPVPSVPQDVQVKLDQHSERFPTTTKRLSLRPQASKDTLNTILSVGSVFPGQAEDKQGSLLLVDSSQVTRKPVAETPKPLEKPKTPRRRSFQSVPASIAYAAASVLPRLPINRKPLPSTSKARKEFSGEASADEIQVGFESNITAIDSIGDSVGNGPFYQAFLALPSQQPVRSPRERTMTLTADMEREMRRSFCPAEPTSPTPQQPVSRAPRHSQAMDVTAKRRSSPPISLHTRNNKTTRKQAPRPKSAHSSQTTPSTRRPALPRQVSRDSVHSYPSTSAAEMDDALSTPPIPPMSPRRGMAMLEQRYAMRRMSVENKWRPTNGWGSEPSQSVRPATQGSATPAGHHSQQQQQQQLRHRSSYDSYTQHRGPVARGPSAATLGPSQGGGYYQQQLVGIQQQQWEQQSQNSPDAVQPGLSRSHGRSRSMHATGHPPFRVLHSYNSPAYRNVPIWG
ncbi:hypothetical protein LZ30DRAFT_583199 [Colletotrichum cereale]|nr:hypothetical protein LZ30DRAFT_583199 [Colletotrichum cereale]